MSASDRRPYLTATVLDQALLDFCADNLETRLEMVAEIETPGGGTIYASDRNKYVGGTFYEALLNFPVIGRTVGEWLSNELQFSTLTLTLSNVDGRFNEFLPGGANYGGWIGKRVTIRLGLAEQASTYFEIFQGAVTDVGGFKRSVQAITVIARDDYDRLNKNFPQATWQDSVYPKIEPKNVGKIAPVIYGDWTTAIAPAPAAVPAFVMNGNDPLVSFKERAVVIPGPQSPAVLLLADHDFEANDPIVFSTSGTLPSPLGAGTTYYVKTVVSPDQFTISTTPGGAAINTSSPGSGDHRVKADATAVRRDVRLRISENDNAFFDTSQVYLKRGEDYFNVPTGDVTIFGLGNKEFDIAQDPSGTWVSGGPFEFSESDLFYVQVKGKDLGAYDDNLVAQSRDIIETYGGAVSGDFDANWASFRDDVAIAAIKSRVWIGETFQALTYALSMLEQVRLEAFISRSLMIKINSLRFQDWEPSPTHVVKNWDVVKDTFQTSIDDKNNFNAAQGVYNFLPDVNQNAYATAYYKNQAAITQVGKRIAKKVIFPNLYVESDVLAQLADTLRLASSSFEILSVSTTWRSALLDIGDFVLVDVKIGSSLFERVPAMVRDFGFDPKGLQVIMRLWILQLVPYPGYTPGYPGTVGGYSATIALDI
jgi:hypothetical protein